MELFLLTPAHSAPQHTWLGLWHWHTVCSLFQSPGAAASAGPLLSLPMPLDLFLLFLSFSSFLLFFRHRGSSIKQASRPAADARLLLTLLPLLELLLLLPPMVVAAAVRARSLAPRAVPNFRVLPYRDSHYLHRLAAASYHPTTPVFYPRFRCIQSGGASPSLTCAKNSNSLVPLVLSCTSKTCHLSLFFFLTVNNNNNNNEIQKNF